MEMQQIGQIMEHLSPVHQPQELTPSKTGELNKLQTAVLSPLICESGLNEISQVLRLVMLKLGIRANNLPGQEETAVLFNHIIENYGGNRIEEIKLAFEMAIAGKLDIETKEVNAYENFSCLYFSKIMNAYRMWSAEAVKQIRIDPPPPLKIYTDQENEDLIRGDIEAFYQRCLAGRVPYALPEYFKPMLVQDGLMKEGETLVEFFQYRLNNGVKNIYIKRRHP
jgi:hypothetical protein